MNDLIVSHPSSIVFFSNLGSPVTQVTLIFSKTTNLIQTLTTKKKLTHEEATLLFTSGFDGKSYQPFFGSTLSSSDINTLVSTFQSILESSKIQTFAVSSLDPIFDQRVTLTKFLPSANCSFNLDSKS